MHTVSPMETIVISIGGSVLLSDDVDVYFFNELKTLLEKLSKDFKIYLVVGGGKTARTYIKLGRELNFKENLLDEIGIEVTKVNAKLLTNILEKSNKKIPSKIDILHPNIPIVVNIGVFDGYLSKKCPVYNKDPNDKTSIKPNVKSPLSSNKAIFCSSR